MGKETRVRLALCCLLAKGHLLIEDNPGIATTALAKVLTRILGLDFRRIQCTSDMLPGGSPDVSVVGQKSGDLTFHPGPIFTQILLVDEINRTTPQTQSTLSAALGQDFRAAPGAFGPCGAIISPVFCGPCPG